MGTVQAGDGWEQRRQGMDGSSMGRAWMGAAQTGMDGNSTGRVAETDGLTLLSWAAQITGFLENAANPW